MREYTGVYSGNTSCKYFVFVCLFSTELGAIENLAIAIYSNILTTISVCQAFLLAFEI